MNFVIANVTTVEEENEEPLFEIKKVSIFKGKKERKTESEVKVTKYKKTCYVPLCPNSSVSTPEKMFITVPVNPERRKKWLDTVGKIPGKNPKSPMFCCQDHFNLKEDMKNYEEHLKKGKVQMLLYQTVVPHIFICNQYGHLKRKERLEVLQKLHKEKNFDTIIDVDDEEYIPTIKQKPVLKRQPKSQIITEDNKRKRMNNHMEEVKLNGAVFLEMPTFEYADTPKYVEINENGIKTIIIDGSDLDDD